MLEIKKISFGYDRQRILSDYSLTCKKGEVISLIGENGSGKTTLLKLIAGLLIPQSGEILLDGKPIAGHSLIAFLETPCWWTNRTAVENVYFALGEKPDVQKLDELLCRFDLNMFAERKVSTFSLGMKKKLAIITAALSKSRIIIIDEPCNSLDKKTTENVITTITQLQKEDKIVIVTGHTNEMLSEMSPKVVLCNKMTFLRE